MRVLMQLIYKQGTHPDIIWTITQFPKLLLTLHLWGWEVFVNGKRQEILKANDAFMAIALPAGEYDVRFKYCTPYLIPGLFITCVSLCMLYGLCLLKNVKTEK